ncbi:glycosyltransferase family 2 protein [Methanoculleus sp. 7T]|uniref:glycosyltransferase family 2 protein n=1 Tax=Methanoculleus sp. 7T TaxID=2937282 RepID=UPI0020BF5D50|nr:glycosyltransferase family 2 protein [Methanoculleus sp. 7T]MCK8518363.1 glycosyltransferase family 2 protein [Methanoculleus sp. 7T]
MTPDISIVIPVYNEVENVPLLYRKLREDLSSLGRTYEIIFIDDGSTDDTFAKLKEVQANGDHIRIIKFRRNFGKAAALNTAFRQVKGEVVITMDGDLQDDSAEIPKFLDKIDEGYDLVSGWKYPRNDPITKTAPSKVFNKLTCWMTGVNLHDFNCGFKAYKREVTDALHLYGELHRYTPVLANYYGFKIAEVTVRHHPREFGKSKYGAKRVIKGLLDLITVKFLTSYASRPLHVFGVPGILSLLVGFFIGLYLVILKYLRDIALTERPLLLLSILLILLGLQFFSIGLLGEMITSRGARDGHPEHFVERIVE